MIYDKVKFSDLFENERQAVVCFLSLEKRYMRLFKDYELAVKSDEYNGRQEDQ